VKASYFTTMLEESKYPSEPIPTTTHNYGNERNLHGNV